MDTDGLTTVLENAGLSPYQAESYVALLELGNASATEVADASAVPDPRIYDVLRDLEEEGFVETYQQDSLMARARDPSSVLQMLRSRSSQYRDAAEEIEARWSRPTVPDHEVSVVKRFDTVLERSRELIADAETQVQVGVDRAQLEALRGELTAAYERGVDVKVSIGVGDDDDVELPDLEDVCTEARLRSIPSPYLVVVDRSWVCFSPHQQSVNEYGIIVDDRSHAYVFHWFFFSSLWDNWSTVHADRAADVSPEYTDIRHCVRDIDGVLQEGATVEATVQGLDIETGADRELTGRITDVYYEEEPPHDEDVSLSQLAGKVSISIDTGDDVYEVGGWGAVLEDVELRRIRIDTVDDG